jgi:hypothetical protein
VKGRGGPEPQTVRTAGPGRARAARDSRRSCLRA